VGPVPEPVVRCLPVIPAAAAVVEIWALEAPARLVWPVATAQAAVAAAVPEELRAQ
jgi:hypothetical protein